MLVPPTERWLPAAATTITPSFAAWSRASRNARSPLAKDRVRARLRLRIFAPARMHARIADARSSGVALGISLLFGRNGEDRIGEQCAIGADGRRGRAAFGDGNSRNESPVEASEIVGVGTCAARFAGQLDGLGVPPGRRDHP